MAQPAPHTRFLTLSVHKVETPKRITADHQAPIGPQREIRLLGDPRQNPIPLARHKIRPVAAHFQRRRAADGALALRPLHNAGDADHQRLGDRPAGLAPATGPTPRSRTCKKGRAIPAGLRSKASRLIELAPLWESPGSIKPDRAPAPPLRSYHSCAIELRPIAHSRTPKKYQNFMNNRPAMALSKMRTAA